MIKNTQNYILLLVFLCFFSIFSSGLLAKEVEKKNILLLHSYHPGMTWLDNINQAVNEVIGSSAKDYVIYTEYMDTKRNDSKEYYESLKELYKKKYKEINFDIILSSDNNAFDFLVKNRDEIFGNVAVSFCGVNGFEDAMLKDVQNFTGAAETFSVKETVDTILTLHPKIKNIYIINDYLATGLAWKKDIQKALSVYDNKVNFIYSENLTLEELRAKVNSLDKDTVILLGVYFADKDKNYITYEKVGSYLLEESKAPVYCLLNFNVSNNVIGGKVISGYTQGLAMSKIAMRILNGEDPDKIDIVFSQANKYVFNHNGLEKYHIDKSLLPKGSSIVNEPFSLYEEYASILFNLIVIFVAILILFISLYLYLNFKTGNESIQKDKLIISFVRFAPIFIIPIVTVLVVWIFVYSVKNNHEKIKEVEEQNYIENMKQQSKREVDRFILISKAMLRSDRTQENLETTKAHLLDIASSIKYGKSGYIIVGSMDGFMLSHPNKELINIYMLDGKHKRAESVFLKFKDKIKKQTNGFVGYEWTNPDTQIEEEKLTYVTLLPELNWYVASGVYLDELDKHIEDKIKSSAVFEKQNIGVIVMASFVLLIFSFILSITLSLIIKNIFNNYRKNILLEVEKSQEIEKSKKLFEELANTDSLTKIHNRHSIMHILKNELSTMRSTDKPLSLLMFDLDFFKSVNDTYGHDVGDKVLINVVDLIKENLRDLDSIGRYGGEEFIVIFPNTTLGVACDIANRLKEIVDKHDFDVIKHLTISIGVVEAKKKESDHEVLKRVDTLLYTSKNNGRNRVSYE